MSRRERWNIVQVLGLGIARRVFLELLRVGETMRIVMSKIVQAGLGFGFLILAGYSPAAGAHLASLTRDVNRAEQVGATPRGARADQLINVGDRLVGSFGPQDRGSDLWISDLTSGGTLQVTGEDGSGSRPGLIASNARTSYWAWEAGIIATNGELAGTRLAVDLEENDLWVKNEAVAIGDELFYVLVGRDGSAIWAGDQWGSAPRRIHSSQVLGGPWALTRLDGGFLFADREAGDGRTELWWSDGTEAGTRRLRAFTSGSFLCMAKVDAGALFLLRDSPGGSSAEELWVSDGSVAGTRRLTHHRTSRVPRGRGVGVCDEIKTLGDRAYWYSDERGGDVELWTTDGTTGGTRQLSSLAEPNPFADYPVDMVEKLGQRTVLWSARPELTLWSVSEGKPATTPLLTGGELLTDRVGNPPQMAQVAGRAFFTRLFGGDIHLWSTDGTVDGTRIEQRLCGAGDCAVPVGLVKVIGEWLYYVAVDRSGRVQLWRTDGSPLGAEQLTKLQIPYALPLSGVVLAQVGSSLVFVAGTAREGDQLRRLDLETGKLSLLVEVEGGTGQADPSDITRLGDGVLFTACDGQEHGLWVSDGGAAGTHPLAGVPRGGNCSSPHRYLTRVAETDFFVAPSASSSLVLWRTDGTLEGTFVLPQLADLFDPFLAALDSRLYLANHSPQLWVSDGTVQGTAVAVDLAPHNIDRVIAAGDQLLLSSRSGRLWLSDGSQAGTVLIYQGNGSLFSGRQAPFVAQLGDRVLFALCDDLGLELWVSDGTAQGTGQVADLSPEYLSSTFNRIMRLGERALFVAATSSGTGLWSTDGTEAGTQLLHSFEEIPPVPYRSPIVVVDGRLYFVADDGEHGMELWRSDGSRQGTELVADIRSGAFSADPQFLTVVEGRLFFSAFNDDKGRELWTSNGTAAGTYRVQDINPGPASSSPVELTVSGSKLFFQAEDGLTGRELWVLDLAGEPGCVASTRYLCLNDGRFRVESSWRDFQGRAGEGKAVALTEDSGYFWFFNPNNVETMVKVLDGRGLNEHFWTFFAVLSDVRLALTVTDSATGLTRRYLNLSHRFASVGDTESFGPLGVKKAVTESATGTGEPLLADHHSAASALKTGCVAGPLQLCLNGGRFAVTAEWEDFQGHTGTGKAVGLTGDSGYFWFFNEGNVEVALKLLDGQLINDYFWVFYGGLSNVAYRLTVTDTETGEVKVYENPARRFASVGDTAAFLGNRSPGVASAQRGGRQFPAVAGLPVNLGVAPVAPVVYSGSGEGRGSAKGQIEGEGVVGRH